LTKPSSYFPTPRAWNGEAVPLFGAGALECESSRLDYVIPANSPVSRCAKVYIEDRGKWSQRCGGRTAATALVERETKMGKLSSMKLVVAFGGLALSLTAGVGVASADPDASSIINTTCSYSQIVAALNAQSPDLANQLNASPMAQSSLQRFLASPPDVRQQTVQQLQNTRWGRQYAGALLQVAGSCNNF
jgi:hemophore-related protein